MNCDTCGTKAIIAGPARCKKHFIEGFEQRVWDTIERFSLIKDGERICVDCDCRPRDYHYTREEEAEMDDAALAHLDPEHGVNTGL